MKKDQIKVGGLYKASVSGKVVTVRVDAIRGGVEHFGSSRTAYDVTNLATGRKITFRSAAKFRGEVKADPLMAPAGVARSAAGAVGSSTTSRLLTGADPLGKPTGGQHTAPASADCPPLPAVEGDEQGPDPTPCTAAVTTVKAVTGRAGGDGYSASPRPGSGFAAKMMAKATAAGDDAPHLIVEARAGTGKTTTLVAALQVLKGQKPTTLVQQPDGSKKAVEITPSPQQQAVWDAVALSRGKAQSVAFVAFNKSIADELKSRVPYGCEAMTMHGLGYRAVQKAFGKAQPVSWRVADITCDMLRSDARTLRKESPGLLPAVERLVSLCKMNLVLPENLGGRTGARFETEMTCGPVAQTFSERLDVLVEHYDIDLDKHRERVYDLVPRVLEACLDVRGKIDFDDMIFLPVVLNLPVSKFDLLLVDEAQDLNRCQQELAKRSGKRLVLCGDPRQAIYGFAGADAESMPRMARELAATDRGCHTVPLTVTRRCGRAIVEEARKIVPDFEAHETNGDGSVIKYSLEPVTPAAFSYRTKVEDGNMVLCRANAPLVSECFKFIKQGRKATIQGREIGQGLVKLVEKLAEPHDPITKLVAALDDWLDRETKKEEAKKRPSEDRIQALEDKHDCLTCFTENVNTVRDVLDKIDRVFTEDKNAPGVRLSSIHKAKGLEARRVFLLQPKGKEVIPDWLDRKPQWEHEQARNLLYVAITRAIDELVYVS